MSTTVLLIVTSVLILLIVLALGAFNIQWNFFLRAIHDGDAAGGRIALTFDDGPHPDYTPQVLALLDTYGVQATFFCIGRNAAAHGNLLRELHRKGHVIGNHTFTHAASIDFNSRDGWLAEIRQTDKAIARVIDVSPVFFRPPYGVTTPHLAAAIRTSGHTVIGWRVRPYDTAIRSPQRIVRRILRRVRAGDIILLHDTHDRIIPVLERLLPELQKRNFSMVTVDQLLQQPAYAELH